MSPKLFSPWAQRIFNWERMCPNLRRETINPASVELLGHSPLFQQRHCIMGGKRRCRRRECSPSLFSKPFVSLLNCVWLPNMSLVNQRAQLIPTTYLTPQGCVWQLILQFCFIAKLDEQTSAVFWLWKETLGTKAPSSLVIQWGQATTCLLSLNQATPYHMVPKSEKTFS